jgi:cyclophilin family peptidyl-prolyl cis-trans isomerase
MQPGLRAGCDDTGDTNGNQAFGSGILPGLMTGLERTRSMKNTLIILFLLLPAGSGIAADRVLPHPHVEMLTSEGTIKLELDAKQAPLTVAHVLELVDSGFYDGTIFHRVIRGFMVQGGGYTPGLKLRESDATIPNESGNGMSNLRGTIAMARTGDPHSANSQFFINIADNDRLDPGKSLYSGSWGYTVFGTVIEGMDIVQKIVSVETGPGGEFRKDVPVIPIIIKKMSRVEYE